MGPGVAGAQASERTILIMPFELVDTSLEGEVYGESPEQTARLAMTTGYIEGRLGQSPRFTVADRRAIAPLLERYRGQYAYVYKCHGCAIEAARRLDAELVMVGWVQKVSNLILGMSMRVYGVADGQLRDAGFVSLRGNTDIMWRRAAARLLKDSLLAGDPPADAPAQR